jgi:hypothetical protein
MAESPLTGDLPLEVRTKATEMATHFCFVFLDAMFLCLWAPMNLLASRIIRWCQLEGSDAIIGFVLQAIFGLATLIPIAIFIYRDVRVIWIKATQKITRTV